MVGSLADLLWLVDGLAPKVHVKPLVNGLETNPKHLCKMCIGLQHLAETRLKGSLGWYAKLLDEVYKNRRCAVGVCLAPRFPAPMQSTALRHV